MPTLFQVYSVPKFQLSPLRTDLLFIQIGNLTPLDFHKSGKFRGDAETLQDWQALLSDAVSQYGAYAEHPLVREFHGWLVTGGAADKGHPDDLVAPAYELLSNCPSLLQMMANFSAHDGYVNQTRDQFPSLYANWPQLHAVVPDLLTIVSRLHGILSNWGAGDREDQPELAELDLHAARILGLAKTGRPTS